MGWGEEGGEGTVCRHAEGLESHRRGRGLSQGLRLCGCRGLRLGLGLRGAGWGGPLGWGRDGEGGGGAAAGGLGVWQVSGHPSRGG